MASLAFDPLSPPPVVFPAGSALPPGPGLGCPAPKLLAALPISDLLDIITPQEAYDWARAQAEACTRLGATEARELQGSVIYREARGVVQPAFLSWFTPLCGGVRLHTRVNLNARSRKVWRRRGRS